MRRYFVIALCIMVIASFIFVVIYIINEASNASEFALTAQQKTIINSAKESGKYLSDEDIDTFTIGQGKQLLDQYLEKNNLNYKVGSKKYIHFLAKIGESKAHHKEPKFTIIDAYATVYLSELQKVDPLFFKFHLKSSTLDKTIKEVRLENNR